ncbi:hypothetical protein SCHPADRAFT_915440 [Schizopora paradoxa]|uniref:EF-hand domain-containing protein n=1 Tax=Schizopora paradoxa TaxID=27342 RepID=A0A0H2RM50_9AGAM|nr:hypothetical protein SCHPADRAFT_915440 [Schizopora paradoxa]
MSGQSTVDEDNHSDEIVAKLDSFSLQVIDDAFDNAVGWHSNERPGKRRRITRSSTKPKVDIDTQGGFVVEDVDMEVDTGGGFIPEPSGEEEETTVDEQPHPEMIPLSLVPTALASLGLPADDEEIMEVFRNASSGWSNSRKKGSEAEGSASVSRRDWRAVCAVLLPNGIPNEGRRADFSDDDHDDDLDFSDVQGGEESDLTEEEEYQPTTKRPSESRSMKRKSKGKSRMDSPLSSDEEDANKPLSPRQKLECRTAFALFFPDLDSKSTELDKRRLTIKDVARCAGSLKEKLTAEDIIEMLRMFSSDASNSPSINLSDFERIMVAVKLV